jgi:uncharacterized protein (DUF983 family)
MKEPIPLCEWALFAVLGVGDSARQPFLVIHKLAKSPKWVLLFICSFLHECLCMYFKRNRVEIKIILIGNKYEEKAALNRIQ